MLRGERRRKEEAKSTHDARLNHAELAPRSKCWQSPVASIRSTCEAYLRGKGVNSRKGKEEKAVREDRKKSQGDRAKKKRMEV